MSELSEKILSVMKIYGRPVTISEISDELALTRATVVKIINTLVDSEKVKLYTTNGKNIYYALVNESRSDGTQTKTSELINELNQKYANLDSDLQSKSEILDKRIEEVENNTKNIYLNIISIMAVFIAIFTLVISNVEMLKEYITSNDTMCDVVMKMAVINIPLLVVIFFILLMIRFLILKPLKDKQPKKEDKK